MTAGARVVGLKACVVLKGQAAVDLCMGKQVGGLRCVVPWHWGEQWWACIGLCGRAVVGLCGQAVVGLHYVALVSQDMGKQVKGLHCAVSCYELTRCTSG